MVIMPALGVDKGKWITVMSVLSILALPLTIMEYYSTKERVTLEGKEDEATKLPFAQQVKAIFTDKYMIAILTFFLIYTVGSLCLRRVLRQFGKVGKARRRRAVSLRSTIIQKVQSVSGFSNQCVV